MADLLPCPFCGRKPWYREWQAEDLATHDVVTWKSVSCPEDCAQISIPDGYEGGSAVERWNSRTPAQAAGLAAGTHVVVPVEATPEIHEAALADLPYFDSGIWRNMLAAAQKEG